MKELIFAILCIILLQSCEKDAIDFENDRNRIISEYKRDTIYVTDSIIVIQTLVVIDTIKTFVHDTIYLNKERKLRDVKIDGKVEFIETYWNNDFGDFKSIKEIYLAKDLKYNITLEDDDLSKILYVDLDFLRYDYVNKSRDEWISEILINSRYLNIFNTNMLRPFGTGIDSLHYFNIISTDNDKKYYSKLDQNNYVRISFNNDLDKNRMLMIIEGIVLKNNAPNTVFPMYYLSFSLAVPLVIK